MLAMADNKNMIQNGLQGLVTASIPSRVCCWARAGEKERFVLGSVAVFSHHGDKSHHPSSNP